MVQKRDKKQQGAITIKLTIPGRLPTTNEINAAHNTQNRYAYAKMKKDYTALVQIHAQKLKPVKKADFTITFYCKDRRIDKDNYLGGLKFIFDGLVKARVIENDGWNQVGEIIPKFAVDKDNPRVEITITEVD